MSIDQSPNRDRLLRTAIRLGPMLDEMVFVGGQMVEHLLTDPAAVRIRPTVDVDAIVGVTSRGAWYDLQRRLETLGFAPDTSDGAPICRTRTADGLVLDAMPLDESILGFGNRWYPYAIDTAWQLELAPAIRIRAITAPALLATKYEAFASRGEGDTLTSPDIEDILTLIAGRAEIVEEVRQAPRDVREFVRERTAVLLADGWIAELVESAIPDARRLPAVGARMIGRLRAISDR